MTTEDDFQAALDANPDDHNTRLVFADWLQERDHILAEGFRALGLLGKSPDVRGNYFLWFGGRGFLGANPHHLPVDWFDLMDAKNNGGFGRWDHDEFWSRYAADNCAALAFARLPESRRLELLNPLASIK